MQPIHDFTSFQTGIIIVIIIIIIIPTTSHIIKYAVELWTVIFNKLFDHN